MKFTGNRETDAKILNMLSDKELRIFCQNKNAAICKDDNFWRDRIVTKYGKDTLSGVKLDDPSKTKYRDFYTSGKAENYALCRQIKREINTLPRSSQLVVDDFYNPYEGFINIYLTRDEKVLTYLLLKIVLGRMTSFTVRNLEDEEKLKTAIETARMNIEDYRRDNYTEDLEFSSRDKEAFHELIDLPVGRPEILRTVKKSIIKALSPNPERKFLFIAYIHQGFHKGQIPLDILWDELCTLPYILKYKWFGN